MRKSPPLKTKLAIIAAIPLAFATILGVNISLERVRDAREFASFQDAMRLANHLARINEAASAEQGTVWSFTPTAAVENGIEVVNGIRAQYAEHGKELDEAFSEMVAFRDSLNIAKYNPDLRQVLTDIEDSISTIENHRAQVQGTMDYGLLIAPYVDFRVRIQRIYPSLLKETSDKDLSLKLSAYNLFLDYYSDVVQYIGVYIWAHQTQAFPTG